jgi:YbgC/YbaW family acyl-CoA thioester hydrolase
MERRRPSGDRRRPDYKLIPRQFDRRAKVFHFKRKIYLTDTNAFQNVYFAQYFDFMGEAREELLKYILGENTSAFIETRIILLTLETSLKYKASSFLFDVIRVEVSLDKISKTKIYLNFRIYNITQKAVSCEGKMAIGTALNGRPIALPKPLYDGARSLFIEGKKPSPGYEE